MTEIRASIVIEMPPERVLANVQRWFGHAEATAGSSRVTLRSSIPGLAAIGAPLQHDADISYVVERDPTSADRTRQALSVRWTPTGGGPFPEMWGLITLRIAAAGATKLEFSGHYAAPLGAAGAAFDKVAGERIAAASVEALLRELREQVLAQDASA